MITLKQFLEAGNYRITEGSEFGWHCFGSNAYMLDVQAGSADTNSATVIFDRVTQEVYQLTCYDYSNERAYRLFGSEEHRIVHTAAALVLNVNDKQAWDEVNYTDLEVAEDFLEKMTAIINNEVYETNISVPLDLDKETLHELMLIAHSKNITLNQMVEEILQLAIDQAVELV
jgi:hypothetical protein